MLGVVLAEAAVVPLSVVLCGVSLTLSVALSFAVSLLCFSTESDLKIVRLSSFLLSSTSSGVTSLGDGIQALGSSFSTRLCHFSWSLWNMEDKGAAVSGTGVLKCLPHACGQWSPEKGRLHIDEGFVHDVSDHWTTNESWWRCNTKSLYTAAS